RQARALRVLLVERRRVALERVEVAADEREVRSVPREMLGDDASDALRGAGDDRDLAREGGGHRCHPRAAGGWSSGTRLPSAPAWRGTLLPGCTERRSGCAVSTRSRQTPRVPPGATTVRSDVSPVSRESLRSTGSASERRSTAACARSPRWSAASPRRKRFVSSCWLTYPRCLSAIRIRWVVGTGRSRRRSASA